LGYDKNIVLNVMYRRNYGLKLSLSIHFPETLYILLETLYALSSLSNSENKVAR
jgi:hypothetical protein